MPSGLRVNFQLAKYVNDENLVSSIESLLEDKNSRLLDLIYQKNAEMEGEIQSQIEALKNEAISEVGEVEGLQMFNDVSFSNGLVIQREYFKFSAKLAKLRNEKTGE